MEPSLWQSPNKQGEWGFLWKQTFISESNYTNSDMFHAPSFNKHLHVHSCLSGIILAILWMPLPECWVPLSITPRAHANDYNPIVQLMCSYTGIQAEQCLKSGLRAWLQHHAIATIQTTLYGHDITSLSVLLVRQCYTHWTTCITVAHNSVHYYSIQWAVPGCTEYYMVMYPGRWEWWPPAPSVWYCQPAPQCSLVALCCWPATHRSGFTVIRPHPWPPQGHLRWPLTAAWLWLSCWANAGYCLTSDPSCSPVTTNRHHYPVRHT